MRWPRPEWACCATRKTFSIYRCGVSSVLLNSEPFDLAIKVPGSYDLMCKFPSVGEVWSLYNGLTAYYIHTLLFKK